MPIAESKNLNASHSANHSREPEARAEQLIDALRSLGSCVVAFSGGVDSAVVAKAAQLALGEKAIAVTGNSPSVAAGELEAARELAQLIGIRHEVVATGEMASESYTRNANDRCYHCKTELYTQLDRLVGLFGMAVVVSGANADDLGDYRTGLTAASEHAVRHPLAEGGFTKAEVRALAAHWKLPVWDKPASPCLSSRIAYGEEVTPARLAMIDRGEQYLRGLGLAEVRVRYHRGDVARLEVPASHIARLASDEIREPLVKHFRELGFKFVTIDLEGFRSGSLNQLVSLANM